MKKIICLLALGIMAFLLPVFISQVNAQNPSHLRANGTDNSGPPWLDPAWHYRKPVLVSNAGTLLPWYQVLVKLDAGNFDFSLANADGSDVRFTHSDGTTGLSFWIESWDAVNQLAYLWVRVPSLSTGSTTLYLYYDNPGAATASNGSTTFDAFDEDWNQFLGNRVKLNDRWSHAAPPEVDSPFTWNIISGVPAVLDGVLSLPDGTGIKSTGTYRYETIGIAMGMRANFGLGSGHEWGGWINGSSGQRSLIRDLPTDPDDLYLVNYRTAEQDLLIPRLSGQDWHNANHIYEIRWMPGLNVVNVDHGAQTASQPLQVPDTVLPVTLMNEDMVVTTLQVDWAYVRQFRDPEPSSAVGVAQGLVDLEISGVDAPDPLPKANPLTYELTVTNNSTIPAPGVIVTDTLPGSVQLISSDPSQGECSVISNVVCSLGPIQANASASITIVVIPHADGVITNTVMVDSSGYELDASDNSDEQQTLVDSEPPTVNWEGPVHNHETYTTFGGMVPLEVSAADNDQVARVEFWFFDGSAWILIGSVYTEPYQYLLDTQILVPDQYNFIEAYSFDRAGNQSSTEQADRQYIYINLKTLHLFYLPFSSR